jgi:hypothetical protein
MFFLDVTDPALAWGSPFIVLAVGIAALVLTVAVPILTGALVRYINKKHDYLVSSEDEAKFIKACHEVVMIVDQNVRKALKLGEEAPDGAKKLEEGLEKLEARLKEEGLYDKFKDRLEDGIEKAVGERNGLLTMKEKDEIRASLPPGDKEDE